MNTEEAKRLIDVIRAAAPAQRFEPETAAVWAAILRDIRLVDALTAVTRVPRRGDWIDPADIVSEVRAIRQARLDAAGAAEINPNVDPDDPRAWAAELAAIRAAIGDGCLDVDAYRRGGLTLTGAAPLRAIGQPDEQRRAIDVSRTIRTLEQGAADTSAADAAHAAAEAVRAASLAALAAAMADEVTVDA